MFSKRAASNSVDASTGRSPMWLRPRPCALRWLLRRDPQRVLGLPVTAVAAALPLPARLDSRKVADVGWAVVFPEGCGEERRQALAPLLELRREQAGPLFQDLCYRPGEGAEGFLARRGIPPGQGPVEPERLPFFLLLVGSPQEIPFEVQHHLDLRYAVGRLHFPQHADRGVDLGALSHYALSVLAAERAELQCRRRAVLFAPSLGDRVSGLITEELVPPLLAELRASCVGMGWEVEPVLAADASKARLQALLGAEEAPALLFAATHGLEFPFDHAEQLDRQGALVCQGWQSGQAPREEHVLDASDLRALGGGLIALLFACFSAGTPQHDRFASLGRPARLAQRDFLARLPLGLLGAENGALAVLGHVDRAWTLSFRWAKGYPLVSTFQDLVNRLLAGEPVGAAAEAIGRRSAELAAEILACARDGDGATLDSLWTAYHDCRSFLLLGDPAVRLSSPCAGSGEVGR